MPAIYTHRVFGREVLCALSPSTLAHIEDNPLLFQMGLHGPDLLFYYMPILPTPLGQLGYSLHHHTGKELLSVMMKTVDSLPEREQAAALSYTLGFACHYLLDSACHPYVYQLVKSGKSDHCTIEAQMDFWLMAQDGMSPRDTESVSHLVGMSEEDFEVIARMFSALSKIDSPNAPLKERPRQIASAHRTMQLLCRIFGSKHALVRGFAHLGLLVSSTYEKRKGMIFPKSPDPAFVGCNQYLWKLLADTVREAPILLEGICRHDLSARFDRTFEG